MSDLAWVTQSQVPEFGLIKTVSVTITDAQIKSLPTTPIEMVPAPGVGKFLNYISGFVILDNTAGVYTNVGDSGDNNASVLRFKSSGGTQLSVLADWDWLLTDGSESGLITMGPYSDMFTDQSSGSGGQYYSPLDGWGDYLSAFENKSIQLVCNNGYTEDLGNLTGGNAANTLKAVVYYTPNQL